MSLYFLLGTLTYESQRMVHDDPDLVIKATRAIEVDGAEVLGQYGVLGAYDYIIMVEADGNDAVARLSLELGVRTGLHIETLPAVSIGALAARAGDEQASWPTSARMTPGR